jgi:hypothetical protein
MHSFSSLRALSTAALALAVGAALALASRAQANQQLREVGVREKAVVSNVIFAVCGLFLGVE